MPEKTRKADDMRCQSESGWHWSDGNTRRCYTRDTPESIGKELERDDLDMLAGISTSRASAIPLRMHWSIEQIRGVATYSGFHPRPLFATIAPGYIWRRLPHFQDEVRTYSPLRGVSALCEKGTVKSGMRYAVL